MNVVLENICTTTFVGSVLKTAWNVHLLCNAESVKTENMEMLVNINAMKTACRAKRKAIDVQNAIGAISCVTQVVILAKEVVLNVRGIVKVKSKVVHLVWMGII